MSAGRTWIRATHPYAFRSGQWAELLTVAPGVERDCYVVRFADDTTDFWAVADPDAGYEVVGTPPLASAAGGPTTTERSGQ